MSQKTMRPQGNQCDFLTTIVWYSFVCEIHSILTLWQITFKLVIGRQQHFVYLLKFCANCFGSCWKTCINTLNGWKKVTKYGIQHSNKIVLFIFCLYFLRCVFDHMKAYFIENMEISWKKIATSNTEQDERIKSDWSRNIEVNEIFRDHSTVNIK